MLVGVVVAICLILFVLALLAPRLSRQSQGAVDLGFVAARKIPKGTPGTVIRNHPRYYRLVSIPQSQIGRGGILGPKALVAGWL